MSRDRLPLTLAIGLLGGCSIGSLPEGGPPFTCPDGGACPSGYSCQQQLCIADGAQPPPVSVAVTALGDGAPVLLWNGTSYAIVWDQTGSGPGVYLATSSPGGTLGPPRQLSSDTDPVSLDALWASASSSYIVAASRNGLVDSALTTFAVPEGGGATVQLAELDTNGVYTPTGFSKPSLAQTAGGDVTLAYTLGNPYDPSVATASEGTDLFCTRFAFGASTTQTNCSPNSAQEVYTAQAASEVLVAEFPMNTAFLYRANDVHLTTVSDDVTSDKVVTGVLHAERFTSIGKATYGLVAQDLSDGGAAWTLRVGEVTAQTADEIDENNGTSIASTFAPDFAASAQTVYACVSSDDGGASIVSYAIMPVSGTGDILSSQGSAVPVPRYSTAEIESCRVVLGADGQLGVLWSEIEPPASSHLYFTTFTP